MVLSPALQAALWSALIFPGVGHFQLKHTRRGMVLAGLTILCLTLLTILYATHVEQAVQAATPEGLVPDLFLLLQHTWQACLHDPWMAYALWALGALWLYAMLDAFLLGRKLQHSSH